MISSKGNLGACLDRISHGMGFRSAVMGTDTKQLPYQQPLLDAIGLFEQLHIGYALIGGVAAMYYGRLRLTEDLDFVASPGHMEVLAANSSIMKERRFDPSCTYKLYHESGTEVDIWKDEYASEIIARAREAELEGRQIRIAEPHDLIAMKLRAGRIQDDYDISQIIRGATIDDRIVQQRVTPQQFSHYLEVKQRD